MHWFQNFFHQHQSIRLKTVLYIPRPPYRQLQGISNEHCQIDEQFFSIIKIPDKVAFYPLFASNQKIKTNLRWFLQLTETHSRKAVLMKSSCGCKQLSGKWFSLQIWECKKRSTVCLRCLGGLQIFCVAKAQYRSSNQLTNVSIKIYCIFKKLDSKYDNYLPKGFRQYTIAHQPVRDQEPHFLLCYRKEPHHTHERMGVGRGWQGGPGPPGFWNY